MGSEGGPDGAVDFDGVERLVLGTAVALGVVALVGGVLSNRALLGLAGAVGVPLYVGLFLGMRRVVRRKRPGFDRVDTGLAAGGAGLGVLVLAYSVLAARFLLGLLALPVLAGLFSLALVVREAE